ncbi:unnamed protein product [Cuscuta epithymum]|uniref:Uncharacterized protein n=1 Tax=Cuscuta epithymum TaxID=186058 RepID=A0AAV0D694_9ASTE|nr:unnamed protein product [Cuscuta epithymum]
MSPRTECSGDSRCNSATKELPEFRKKILRARGILKGDPTMDSTPPSNRSHMLPSQKMLLLELPPGWVMLNQILIKTCFIGCWMRMVMRGIMLSTCTNKNVGTD